MTKVTILGQDGPTKQKLTPIEFKFQINGCIEDIEGGDDVIDNTSSLPNMFDNIELVCKGDKNFYDIMFAYNTGGRENGSIFLGYFNDGIVE